MKVCALRTSFDLEKTEAGAESDRIELSRVKPETREEKL
jgi:hypothetical protein